MDFLYYLIQVNVYSFSGTVSNGGFCSLRMQGETRALHVWQLKCEEEQSNIAGNVDYDTL